MFRQTTVVATRDIGGFRRPFVPAGSVGVVQATRGFLFPSFDVTFTVLGLFGRSREVSVTVTADEVREIR